MVVDIERSNPRVVFDKLRRGARRIEGTERNETERERPKAEDERERAAHAWGDAASHRKQHRARPRREDNQREERKLSAHARPPTVPRRASVLQTPCLVLVCGPRRLQDRRPTSCLALTVRLPSSLSKRAPRSRSPLRGGSCAHRPRSEEHTSE